MARSARGSTGKSDHKNDRLLASALVPHTKNPPPCDISHKAGDFVLGQGRGTESSPRDGTCALFHFFEVHIFTLVFGEDLFLLPSGVGFRGTAAGVLASSVLLFACIKIGSRLLVGTVGHVKAIREANSEERQDEIQNASESNAKEDNKSYHKGEKTSERGVHTVEVWGDGSKKGGRRKDVREELAGIQSYMSSVWGFLLTRGDANPTVVRKKQR